MNRMLLAVMASMVVAACSPKPAADASVAATPPAATPMAASNMPMMASDPSDTAATKGYKAAMMKMMGDSPKSFSGDPDVDFFSQMRVHHEAAIDMATVELSEGNDPAVKALARNIIAAQQKEIATMNAWLKQHGH